MTGISSDALLPSASTIFVVDDDDAVRDSISALLELNDRIVRPCASAQEFLACYHGQAYCLLLDVEMPEMTGLDLVKHLAQSDHLPPTVMLTAHAEEPATQAALQSGVHRILSKPSAEDVLLAAIDSAARAHRGNPL